MTDKTTQGNGYQGDITLTWSGDYPAGIENAVVDDIRRSLWGLGAPEDLWFHSVFLTQDMNGPSVFVWGEAGSPSFHCEYCVETKWSSDDPGGTEDEE